MSDPLQLISLVFSGASGVITLLLGVLVQQGNRANDRIITDVSQVRGKVDNLANRVDEIQQTVTELDTRAKVARGGD